MKYTNVPTIIVLREKVKNVCHLVAYNVLTYRGHYDCEFITVEGDNIYFNRYINAPDETPDEVDFERRKVNECDIVDRFTDMTDFHNKYSVEEVIIIMDEDGYRMKAYVSPNAEYFINKE